MPIMRPVLMADPKDPTLRMEDQAFLLGGDLLVIPQWAASPALPGGIWRRLPPAGEDSQADPYQCDLRIRGGAIVPLGKIVQNTVENSLDELTLVVCLDEKGAARGTLYEDAGDGYEYLSGAYRLTEYIAQRQDNRVVVRVNKQEGQMETPRRKVHVELITDGGVIGADGDEQGKISIDL
jgi:alpha-glucosidase